MAYTIYNTDAFVCGSYDRNTSDREFYLFTREAGMVRARAKSVREERSKQRYALQDFSIIRASILHGRIGWRLVGVEPKYNFFINSETREERRVISNTVKLLRRLLHGETPQPELFDYINESLISVATGLHDYSLSERVIQIHILYLLGYISPQDKLKNTIMSLTLEEGMKNAVNISIQDFDKDILKALELSQL